jgi:uncharacterized protein (TIGR03083 family)
MGLGDGYQDGRQRTTSLLMAFDEDAFQQPVPLNPAWRIRDVIAHEVGVSEEALSGYVPDAEDPKRRPDEARARDEWTQAQVVRRQDVPVSTMLEEWKVLAADLVPLLNARALPSGFVPQVKTAPPLEVGCHLHDLRHALGQPGDRDAPTTRVAFAIARGWLNLRLEGAQLPALRLRAPEREWVIGNGSVEATLEADEFELFRVLTGRRSRHQILSMNWDVDPVDYIETLSPYPFPADDIAE